MIVSTHRTISSDHHTRKATRKYCKGKCWTMELSDYQAVKLHTHTTLVDFVGRLNLEVMGGNWKPRKSSRTENGTFFLIHPGFAEFWALFYLTSTMGTRRSSATPPVITITSPRLVWIRKIKHQPNLKLFVINENN